MALTDVVFSAGNSAVAARGDTGAVQDILFFDLPGHLSPLYDGKWTVTELFKNSASANVPDGTIINAFDASTHKRVGTGVTSNGTATIKVSSGAEVYLVVAPGQPSMSGETVCTTPITPG